MAILEALIILMIKSHGHAATCKQVLLINVKQANYDTFVQLRELGKVNLEHL